MNPSDDELASAWLDGELTQAELSQVEPDPHLRRARDELRRVRDELGEPVAVPGDLRDRQIALAVAEGVLGTSGATEEGRVVSLSSPRAVSGSSWWLSRAAVAALVVGGLGAGLVVLAGNEADDDTMATGTLATESAESDEAGDAAARATQADEAEEGEAAALTAPAEESMTDEARATAAASSLSAVASELASQGLDAGELFDELELRFGPVETWPLLDEAPSRCAGELDQRQPDDARHVAVPLERAGVLFELIVPSGSPPRYVDPTSCLVVD